MPVTVRRIHDTEMGTVQLFVEHDNVKTVDNPAHLDAFDQLIGNEDRNKGNYLIAGPRVVAIDHGKSMAESGGLTRLTDAIRTIPDSQWRTLLTPTQTERQIRAFLARRTQVVKDFDFVVERYGADIFK